MMRLVSLVLLLISIFVFCTDYPTTIDVLLSKSLSSWGSSSGYDFDEVAVKSSRIFKILGDGFEITVPPGKEIVFRADEKGIKAVLGDLKAVFEEIELVPLKGEITLLSAKRKLGTPSYPGKLILRNISGKLYVVNEVSIEEYVKRVLPSEMPISFPKESLKAQAVAARSLAVLRALKPLKSFSKYGADCDDSVRTQVYNNLEYNQTVEEAVEETEGIVMFYGENLVSALNYFSTSSGFTANVEEVWSDGDKFPGRAIPYLRSQPQFEGMEIPDVSKEDVADWFFRKWDWEGVKFYDYNSPWFRWKVTLTGDQLEKIISKTIPQREKADKILKADFIRVIDGMAPDDPNFSVGKLLDLRVLRRGAGGNVMTLEIIGTNGRWAIDKEYNIRLIIRPRKDLAESEKDIVLFLHTGLEKPNYSILPSAFFTMDVVKNERGEVESVTFWGGGNGHGVGMSQYGAKFLGENGYSYEEILKKYYYGVEFKKVY